MSLYNGLCQGLLFEDHKFKSSNCSNILCVLLTSNLFNLTTKLDSSLSGGTEHTNAYSNPSHRFTSKRLSVYDIIHILDPRCKPICPIQVMTLLDYA